MNDDVHKIITLDECKEYWEEEFYWIAAPLVLGGRKKYPRNNWLKPDGIGTSRKENAASLFRHTGEYSVGLDVVPDARSVTPEQCIGCRGAMATARRMKGIIHPAESEVIISPELVQCCNSQTKLFVLIDKSIGEIIDAKETPGPFPNVPIVGRRYDLSGDQ